MSTNSTNARPGEGRSHELDEVLKALANSKRRAILRILQERQKVDIEELAATVGDEQTTSQAKVELVHNHLPQLADANIVEYDADHVCELDTNEVALRILENAESMLSDGTGP